MSSEKLCKTVIKGKNKKRRKQKEIGAQLYPTEEIILN